MLSDHQISKIREPNRLSIRQLLRKVFLEDWTLKLTALVITLALWFGVTGLSTPVTKRFSIRLIPSIATNVEIVNTPREEVDIVVSGDKRKVDQLSGSDLIAALDLRDVSPGDWVISLSPETVSVTLPQGVKLVEVQPSRIPINLEAVEERDVDVKVVMSGTLLPGFEVYSANPLPAKIRVRGPASFVRALQNVETDPVDIGGRDKDFTARQVPVGVSNRKASVLNTVVDVVFRIGEKRIERTFLVPVAVFPGPTAGIEGKTALLTIFGPRTAVQAAQQMDFRIEPAPPEGGQPRVIMPPELENIAEVRKVVFR
jgi:hypothetical protein